MPETLKFCSAIDHPELVGPTLTSLLQNWQGSTPIEDIQVAQIDPTAAGGNDFCSKYGISPNSGANCVIIEGSHNDRRVIAACVMLVGYRANFNTQVKKTLRVKRVSVAPLAKVLVETQMGYGSITPFGLPEHWPILLDSRILEVPRLIIGSGLVNSKLALPGKALIELANAVSVENLATKIT